VTIQLPLTLHLGLLDLVDLVVQSIGLGGHRDVREHRVIAKVRKEWGHAN
jgi:hypothetical protein